MSITALVFAYLAFSFVATVAIGHLFAACRYEER